MKMNSTNFIPWFIGFLDAEGNFQVTFSANKNKDKTIITSYTAIVSIHIGLNIVDKDVLFFIQNSLGNIGKVYLYPHRNEAHYYLSKKDIPEFINKVFSQHSLLTSYQYSRYSLMKYILENNITNYKTKKEVDVMKSMPISAPNPFDATHKHIFEWGFINGEGSFGVYKNNSVFRFYIEHTDKEVLLLIRMRLGLTLEVITRPVRGNRKQTFVLSVSSKEDIQEVITFIDNHPYLIGKKLEQYVMFRNK